MVPSPATTRERERELQVKRKNQTREDGERDCVWITNIDGNDKGACLLEKEVEFKLVNVDMGKGRHKSSQFLELQPFGQVPVFQDENITLFESRAICRYVCHKYGVKGNKHLMGRGLQEHAHIEQWLEVEAQNYHPPITHLVLNLALAPLLGLKPDREAIERNAVKLGEVLDVYDRRLRESRFLAGDDFTLADLNHLSYAQYLVNTEERHLLRSRKNVNRWWEEISGRPSWKKVVELQQQQPPSTSAEWF